MTDTKFGIFLEHQLETESDWDVSLLGYRFDDQGEADFILNDWSGGHSEVATDGEHFWAVPESDLPYGYKLLVYYVGKINAYDLERYAI